MDKEDIHTYTHNQKKEWNFAICNNAEGLGNYFAKWKKSYMLVYMISLMCGI